MQIGRDANVALDEAGLYESMFKNICELIPVDRGVIAMANDENESLFLSYVSGVYVE